MKIGFTGLGNMGAPMAANLASAGHRAMGLIRPPPARRCIGYAPGSSAELMLKAPALAPQR
jgi:3-hydroxyisobutyrate dehydrogenase